MGASSSGSWRRHFLRHSRSYWHLQVVFDPDTEASFALADSVRNEFVLWARGKVRPRPEGTINPDMRTGEIEVLGLDLTVLNAAKTPPFQLDEYSDAGEDIRLRYRYLDHDVRKCSSDCKRAQRSPAR